MTAEMERERERERERRERESRERDATMKSALYLLFFQVTIYKKNHIILDMYNHAHLPTHKTSHTNSSTHHTH